VIPYKEELEQTVFQLASDMLKDICQVVHEALRLHYEKLLVQ
jgi:hypothetical protein